MLRSINLLIFKLLFCSGKTDFFVYNTPSSTTLRLNDTMQIEKITKSDVLYLSIYFFFHHDLSG